MGQQLYQLEGQLFESTALDVKGYFAVLSLASCASRRAHRFLPHPWSHLTADSRQGRPIASGTYQVVQVRGSDLITIGSWDNALWLYSVGRGRVVDSKPGQHEAAISCLCESEGRLVSGSWDSTIRLWSLSGNALECLGQLTEHDDKVKLAFTYALSALHSWWLYGLTLYRCRCLVSTWIGGLWQAALPQVRCSSAIFEQVISRTEAFAFTETARAEWL